jgi:hypothetical protein
LTVGRDTTIDFNYARRATRLHAQPDG